MKELTNTTHSGSLVGKRNANPLLHTFYQYAISFLLPILVLCIVYIVMRIAPFGDQSILTIDMERQYVQFFAHWKEVLQGQADPFYTFSKNTGGSMIGLINYYLLSPFNLVFLFFDKTQFPYAVVLLTLLKIGFCGLTMQYFLKCKGATQGRFLFSTSYALMSYNIVYQQNIMWLDAVILLPLIVLGLERLIEENRIVLYVVALTAGLTVQYYIGYMLVVFSFLYVLFLLFYKKRGDRRRLFARYAVSSAFVAGISMVILLPTLFTLVGGKTGFSSANFNALWNFDLLTMLSVHFSNSSYFHKSIYGYPNVYAGMLVLALLMLFFGLRTIPGRKKISYIMLLLFLYLSFLLRPLDLLWHGLNKPMGFNHRYSFLFSFLVILIASEAYQKMQRLSVRRLLALLAGVCAASIVLVLEGQKNLQSNSVALSLVFFSGGIALLYLEQRRRGRGAIPLSFLLMLLVCADLGTNAYYSLIKFNRATVPEYVSYIHRVQPMTDYIKDTAQTPFYRTEKTFFQDRRDPSKNDAMMFDYYGLTHFSSTEKTIVKDFTEQLGFNDKGLWAWYNKGSTLAVDSFMGIRYLITENLKHKEYKILKEFGNDKVVENPYALPLGFAVKDSVKDVKFFKNALHPFDFQNELFMKASTRSDKEHILVEASNYKVNLRNVQEGEYVDTKRYRSLDRDFSSYVDYQITVQSSKPLYAFFNTNYYRAVRIYINGYYESPYFTTDHYNVISLGTHKPGEVIHVTMELVDGDVFIQSPQFYYQDLEGLQAYYDEFQSHPFRITSFRDSDIKGTVDMPDDKDMLLLTIPYEKDWRITVDGTRVNAEPAAEALMGIRLSPGSHEVHLKYIPRGLRAGAAVSALSTAGFVSLLYLRRQARRTLLKTSMKR